ncbi:MAG: BFO_1060 family glycosyltransferase [Puniceicoccaceae bacterium]
MQKKRRQLLYFTNNDSGRDVEMLLPLLYFAERFLNCEVTTSLTPNIHEIFRRKPDCVVLANTIGAKLHFDIARIATGAGIPVFALVSEGNFPTDGSFNYWGYNSAQKLYEAFLCCWSPRTRDFMQAQLPDQAEQIVLTGAPGFDRYQIYSFSTREALLEKHGIDKERFKRFIGYAGWGFGKLGHPRGRKELRQYFKGDAGKLDWAEQQRKALEKILEQAVVANPDTLFIFKKHPTETVAAEGNADLNEMAALRHYPNVLYLLEENLHDIISSVDLWWVYESTTAIEADMMGKETVFIVPDDDFPRTELHEGFPEVRNYPDLQQMTEAFFSGGSLPSYEALSGRRNEIIVNTIGWSDGLNHVRAAYYLSRTLESAPPAAKSGISWYYFLVYWILRGLTAPWFPRRLYALPFLSSKSWVLKRYSLVNLPRLRERYRPFLESFYTRNDIPGRFRDGSLFSSVLKQSNSNLTDYGTE